MAIWDLGILIARSFEWIKCLERLEKKSRCKFQVSTSTLLEQAAFQSIPST